MAPLAVLDHPLVPRRGQAEGQRLRIVRQVVAVLGQHVGQLNSLERVLIEPAPGGVHRNMRAPESCRQEEWALVILGQLRRGPVSHAVVGHLRVALGVGAPVPQRVADWKRELLLRPRAEATHRSPVLVKEGPLVTVVHLANAERRVALGREPLDHRDCPLQGRLIRQRGQEEVHAGRRGQPPGHHRGARRRADGGLTVRVGEQGPARRQPIDVGGLRLRVPPQRADPVVEVVHGDQQHVGALVLRGRGDGEDQRGQRGPHGTRDEAVHRGPRVAAWPP